MASIRKRRGRWQVQVRRKGHSALSRTFLSKADAFAWARQLESKIDRRELPPDTRTLKRTTLREILSRYRDTVVSEKRSCSVETTILNALLKTKLAKLSLADLSPEPVAEYRDQRLRSVKPVTVNRELQLVQHALKLAKTEWAIPLTSNPLESVRRPKNGDPRDRRLQAGEWERLTAAARDCRNRYILPLAELAIETAMRQGELLGARWSDLNVAARTLRIRTTKNGHARTIPLSRAAIECLLRLRAATAETNSRITPISREAVKQAWKRLVLRADLPDLHFHDLRHEACDGAQPMWHDDRP